jgi:hypothetical protein
MIASAAISSMPERRWHHHQLSRGRTLPPVQEATYDYECLGSPAFVDGFGTGILIAVFALIIARLVVPAVIQHKVKQAIHHPVNWFRETA